MAAPKQAPYTYDIVGSFLRPTRLREARAAFATGGISRDELTAVEDECITELVEREKAAGLRAVTDGSFAAPCGTSTFSRDSRASSA